MESVESVPKIKQSVTLTIKILNAYDKERNLEVGCADYRFYCVCHPYRTRSNVVHGNVEKGKKVKK